MRRRTRGFTLIEILIVIAIISILAAVVIVAINPAKMIRSANDAQRLSNLYEISNALNQYGVDHRGTFPALLDSTWRMIGTAVTGCDVPCGTSSTSTLFRPSTQSDFLLGSFTNTQYSVPSSGLNLTPAGQTAGTGTYLSVITDSGNASTKWSTLTWTPSEPVGKHLPAGNATETSYFAGNANMSGNIFLAYFEEGVGSTTFVDSSGNHFDASCSNPNCPTAGVTGILQNAIQLNGSSQFLSIANQPALNPTSALTIEAWEYWNVPIASGLPWATIVNKAGDNEYRLQHSSDNTKFEFAVATTATGGTGTWVQSTTTPTQGRWYHIVGTYDGTLIHLYVNGVQEATAGVTGTILSSNSPLYIGAFSGNARYFNGDIDEIALYSRALPAQEVADHYHRGEERIRITYRACQLANCSDANLVGPSGVGTYYSEETSSALSTPTYAINGIGRYAQFGTTLTTGDTSLTPVVKNISLTGSQTSSTGMLAASCVDLLPSLAPTYLASIPFDPVTGSSSQTYYAVRKNSTNRIETQACSMGK